MNRLKRFIFLSKNRKIRFHTHYATELVVEIWRAALPNLPLRFTYTPPVTRMIWQRRVREYTGDAALSTRPTTLGEEVRPTKG